MIYDIIVVGAGAAGMSAALYALRNNKKVLLIEKEGIGGQIALSPRLENYPSIKSISGLDFANNLFDQIMDLNCEFECDEVKEIKKADKIFEVTTIYKKYQSKTVILATGCSARSLGLPNESKLVGHGVSYCAVCDGAFYKDQETCIIGDANTALQYAIILAQTSTKVHIKTLFDKFFADPILVDRIKSNPKIDFEHNVELKEIIEEDGNVKALKFVNTKTQEVKILESTNVFICIGQIPHNEAFKDLVKLEKGFIVTNENMETSFEGVFACGDTTKKNYRQVIMACNDGAIAALSAMKYIDSNNL